jgi:hypothetical protein
MHFDSKQNGYDTLFTGLNAEVPLLNGERRRFTNLDNAASTPPLKAVQKAVNDFMIYYSSVHRGTGYKSQLSTHVYEMARKTVLKFVYAFLERIQPKRLINSPDGFHSPIKGILSSQAEWNIIRTIFHGGQPPM